MLKLRLNQQGFFVALLLALLVAEPSWAQGITAALTKIKQNLSTWGNVLFAIMMLIGIVRVIIAFVVEQDRQPFMKLVFVLVAAVCWFAFNFFVDDIAGMIGGAGGYTPNN